MNKLNYIICFLLLSSSVDAKLLFPRKNKTSEHLRVEDILTKIFYDELYKHSKGLKPEIEVKKAQISPNFGRRGKMITEMMLQKNREKIAKLRGLDPSRARSGKEIVGQQKEKTKNEIKTLRALEKRWIKEAKVELNKLKNTVLVKNKGWKKKHIKTLKEWEKDYRKYVGKVEDYKEGLTNIPLILPISKEEANKALEVKLIKESFIVPGSLSVKISDQGKRPTCSSFAGVRAMEILLTQNNSYKDLSEQYFYWSSKPKCRTTPCSRKGSWVGYGVEYSKGAHGPNIPMENSCPYRNVIISHNDTQIPLEQNCNKGHVQVDEFEYIKTLDHVLSSIKDNVPVVAGVKLSQNFYTNRGIVLQKDAKSKGSDDHAKGHAILLIGYLKLPKVLNEGKVCFITANSWGTGWGHGGHACLSEKWLIEHRNRNPFVAIKSLLTI